MNKELQNEKLDQMILEGIHVSLTRLSNEMNEVSVSCNEIEKNFYNLIDMLTKSNSDNILFKYLLERCHLVFFWIFGYDTTELDFSCVFHSESKSTSTLSKYEKEILSGFIQELNSIFDSN